MACSAGEPVELLFQFTAGETPDPRGRRAASTRLSPGVESTSKMQASVFARSATVEVLYVGFVRNVEGFAFVCGSVWGIEPRWYEGEGSTRCPFNHCVDKN